MWQYSSIACDDYIHHSLLCTVPKWINTKGRCVYKDGLEGKVDVEMRKFSGLIIVSGIWKSKEENIL